MEVVRTRQELQQWIAAREDPRRTLVPTMGALHQGHTSLFDRAAKEEGPVVATIFVNPTQFGPNEDFDAYPRTLEIDLAQCEAHGVDLVFAPEPDEMYESDATISISESTLSQDFCGSSREGHFDGVCLVVAKLFNLTQPQAAVFGEKDFQQLAIIRRLVRDLNYPIRIIGGQTVREPDGLAMSSRNAYLTDTQRQQAPIIQQALKETADGIATKKILTSQDAETRLRDTISSASEAKIDYLGVVDAETLEPLEQFGARPIRLLAAAFFGKTRLIDNVGVQLIELN